MRIKSFSVKNFRSIVKADRLPCGHAITTLVGPNNEGKSNILRALAIALRIARAMGSPRMMFQSPTGPFEIGARHLRDILYVEDAESEFSYSWPRDFPLHLQESNRNGRSEFILDFELSSAEEKTWKKSSSGSADMAFQLSIAVGSESAIIDVPRRKRAKSPSYPVLAFAHFVANRIDCQYIPSVRTARSARDIVEELVARELSKLEQDNKYVRAQSLIEKLQKPVLRDISRTVTASLKQFLPSVKNVKVAMPRENRYRALKRSCAITVDDGVETDLQRKGDGIQSLAALSLMRHVSMLSAQGKQIILALEEPETHLHPSAIHQLRQVLAEIAQKHQVILTTHNPLFVSRDNIGSNIVVSANQAAAAGTMEQIRDILGVRPTDNLQHAEMILLVEGEDDKIALQALLPKLEPELDSEIRAQTLVIEPLFGASKLLFRLQQLQLVLCPVHVLLDHDRAGKEAFQSAVAEQLLKMVDSHFVSCRGMPESELEDTFVVKKYAKALKAEFGVDLSVPEFRGNKKWSERMRHVFQSQGKGWDDSIKSRVKMAIAYEIAKSPGDALIIQKSTALKALGTALRDKLRLLRENSGVE